jgi:galactokinase
MSAILEGSTLGFGDVDAFLALLDEDDLAPPGADVWVARAPGRLDVMGGIADYSGSLVLELPLAEATLCAVARRPDRRICVLSAGGGDGVRSSSFEIDLGDLESAGAPIEYEAARTLFARDPRRSWGAYVAGVWLVLMRERGVRFRHGASLRISSSVPEGKGVSSSAALEVAAIYAVAGAFGIALDPREAALLCQTAENRVVGAPCGVMDQMTAACGEADALLALRCRPAELEGMISVPADLALWGIDSGLRHAVSGSDYGAVRAGAFMGRRIIVELAGGAAPYLADLPPSLFAARYAERIPERMRGADFLALYGALDDPVTRIEPEREYAVRAPTAHPIAEGARVRAFAKLLAEGSGASRELLGELMFQSHASYGACGLGTDRTDLLVELVRGEGPGQGLYGARITGGGSGGTVAILARRGADAALARVVARFRAETGHDPHIFSRSSPGAARFGHLRARTDLR